MAPPGVAVGPWKGRTGYQRSTEADIYPDALQHSKDEHSDRGRNPAAMTALLAGSMDLAEEAEEAKADKVAKTKAQGA
jgi:hypothetical protein